jgi:hypothetical protein
MIVLNSNLLVSPADLWDQRSNNLRDVSATTETNLQSEIWKCPGGVQ